MYNNNSLINVCHLSTFFFVVVLFVIGRRRCRRCQYLDSVIIIAHARQVKHGVPINTNIHTARENAMRVS